jgi:predicted molibdopterin-dependent oxidoreductase YjgC
VNHYRDRVWRLMPRRNDAVNETWMCDHGRLNYEFVNSAERLRQPLVRRDGALVGCEWEEAIAAAATHLRRLTRTAGGGAIGAVASPHLTNEEHFRFAQLLRALDVTNVDVAVRTGRQDDLLIKAEKAANARGARDMGLGPTADGLGLPALLEAAANGRIRALYVCGPDLWETADRQLLERAVTGVECLIVQDVLRTPLAERAHVVLPSMTFAEKVGTFTNFAGRVQRLQRAIQPGERPCDGEIFSRILGQLVEGRWTFVPERILEEIAQAVPRYAGLTYAKVGSHGWTPPAADEQTQSAGEVKG